MKDVSIKTKLLLLVILSIFIVSLVLIISSIISINYISESNINKYEKESYWWLPLHFWWINNIKGQT